MKKKTNQTLMLFSVLLLLCGSITGWAAEGFTGTWEVPIETHGRVTYNTLVLAQKEDGTLTGTWNNTPLSHIKFTDDKLTFCRTVKGFNDREFTTDYWVEVKDGTLKGSLCNDWFDATFIGIKPKPMCAALGTWHIGFNVGDRDIKATLCISENKDGSLAGTWTEEGQHSISDMAFKDSTLTFTRQSKIQDVEFTTTYKGTIKGHVLTGMLYDGDRGPWEADGKRAGAPLIGTWEFENTTQWGPPTRTLIIYPDMTGRYQGFDGFIPIQDLKLEGDDVTFKIEGGFGGRTFVLEFKGKLAEETLKGEMISERGNRPANAKKVKETVQEDIKEEINTGPAATDK